MITVESLRNPKRRSGFDRVRFENYPGRAKPYAAEKWEGSGSDRWHWTGPHRATAEEAAQDYVDYVNQGGTPATPAKLKSAGHAYNIDGTERDPEVEAALGVLRDAKAQRQGRQGYVYLIVEDEPIGMSAADLIAGKQKYGKIGYSVNPEKRVAELQTGNPRPLKLLYKMPGTPADEAALHAKHIDKNILQEWFAVDRDIILDFPAEGAVK